MANTVYDPDADERPVHHTPATDDELRQITGINPEQETAYDREAQRGITDTSGGSDSLFNPGGDKAVSGGAGKAGAGGITQGGLYNAAENLGGPASQLLKLRALVSRNRRKSTAGAIAVITSLVIIVGAGSVLPLEFVHLRENMLGNGNKLVNYSLQQRRVKTFQKIASKLHQGSLQSKLTKGPQRLKANFEKQGFKTEFDKDGKLQKLSYTSERTGETRSIDYSKGDLKGQSTKFFDDAGFGREASRKLDIAVGGKAASWKGVASRKLYGRLNVHFNDWLDRKSKEKDKQTRLADNLQAAEKEDNGTASRTKKTNDPRKRDANGNPLPGEVGLDDSTAQALDTQTDGLIKPDASVSESSLTDALDGKAVAGSVVKGLGAFGAVQQTCSIDRDLKLVRYLKNVAVTTQLARFTFRYLNAADSQKAGVLSSDGLSLLATYMNTPDTKTGRTALNSGGVLNTVFGKKDQHPTKENLAKYSSSHSNHGVLAKIDGIISSTGLSSSGTACHIVDNTFVGFGSLAIGIGAAVFSGGTFTAGNAAVIAAQGAAGFAASYYAKQLLIKSANGVILTGFESGGEAGDALASGWGSSRGMTANVNGLRPITKPEAAKIAMAANQDQRDKMAGQSLYARYFDTKNVNSLTSNIATTIAKLPSFSSLISKMPHMLFGSIVANASHMISPATFAAPLTDKSLCPDPIPANQNILVDDYCNPEVAAYPNIDIDQTEQVLLGHTITWYSTNPVDGTCTIPHEEPAPLINADGTPIAYADGAMVCNDPTIHMNDDLLDYAYTTQEADGAPKPECLVGRVGILYAPYTSENIDGIQQISEHEVQGKPGATIYDNPCIKDGDPLKNDSSGVGRFVRYTAWYGYMLDEKNFVEQANGDYSSTADPLSYAPLPSNRSVGYATA